MAFSSLDRLIRRRHDKLLEDTFRAARERSEQVLFDRLSRKSELPIAPVQHLSARAQS